MSKLKDCIQRKIEKKIRCTKPILLNNCSFKKGTYRITKPGYYKLQENIVFKPLVNDIFLPKKFSNKYPRNIYFLGFFAAITIECNYVILDLNDFKIEMDPLFSLFQRFFSIIELANTPFIRNEGPTGSFDDNGVRPANYLIIKNGCIGNSSHSAIHGNNNKYIVIENLVCKDFETSGIVLNNVKKSVIENCEIGPSNKKVLVNSLFFPFVNLVRVIISNNLQQSNKCYKNILIFKEAVVIFKKIIDNYKLYNTIFDKKDNFYNNIIAEFYNISGLPDGSALYGLSFTAAGISVKGFGCCLEKNPKEGRTKNIYIDNVKINCLCLNTMETIAMKIDDKIIRGAFGEIITPMDNSKFITDLQFSLWDFILRNPDLNIKTTFNKDAKIYKKTRMLYDKIRFKIDLPEKINYKIEFGGDIMNHYNKGIIGIRVEYVETILIKNTIISYLQNLTKKTLMNKDDDNNILIKHDKINMFESLESYIGTAIFGIICLESKCIINNYLNNNLNSTNGEICECITI